MRFTNLLFRKPIVFILLSGGFVVVMALSLLFALKVRSAGTVANKSAERGISSSITSGQAVFNDIHSGNSSLPDVTKEHAETQLTGNPTGCVDIAGSWVYYGNENESGFLYAHKGTASTSSGR